MLLAPQHFQLQSLRQETLLHYHSAAIAPFHWGVRHLEVDSVMLVDGVFRVLELEAVMPDGLVVAHGAGEVPDLSIDLKPFAAQIEQAPMTIWLAVVSRGSGVAFAERYSSVDGGPIVDENTGEGDLPVAVLKPRLCLLAADDLPPKYTGFPLAEVTYRNEVFTRTPFEPPLLRVAAGSVIYEICQATAARLREKSVFLADQVHAPSSATAVPQLLETKALVHCLVGELPAFEAVLRTGVSHPFPLYVALCSVLGHVAGVGRSLIPPVLDPYDHNDLVATFQQVQTAISKAISEGIQESYTAYPFLQQDDEFKLLFDAEWMGRALILGVRAPSGVSEAEMTSYIGGSLIASRSRVVSLRDRRVLGVRRVAVSSHPDLVPPRGVTLFSIPYDPEFIAPGEELVISNPRREGRARPDWIVLFVRNR
jgi:type VI secretion system protein ImpJ